MLGNKRKGKSKIPKELLISIKERTMVLLILFGVSFLGITIVLVYRMVFKASEYKKMADEQIVNEIQIDAKRGRILDRNGKQLAVSGDVYRIDADLITLRNTIEKKAQKNGVDLITQENILTKELNQILDIDEEILSGKINSKLESGALATSAIFARRVSKEQADAIKNLGYYGFLVSSDTKRYYPNEEFSSYILGNVNQDGKGLNGIELYYDSILSGIPGVRIAEVDNHEKNELPLELATFTPPIHGKDLVLTIDEKIQYISEKAAEKALKEHDAESVSILIMDPNNNEILALATNPDYNPNKPNDGFEKFAGKTESDKIQRMWRNKIVSDLYEPGSTFKIITAAAAVEEGLANKGETYYCNGYKKIDDRRINCWYHAGHGPQTFTEIIENSCNVGLMELGNKLGKEKLYEYITSFGFGKETGIDISGESLGIVKKPDTMSDVDLATISFGQTNAVSMIQLLTGFNATINGGYLMTPHLMKDIVSTTKEGAIVINDTYDVEKKQVISEKTSKMLREALESVVKNGTGSTAYIEGFKVGGKTGTAQMVDANNGGYGAGRIASFIAMAPADNPKISILVTINKPQNGTASGSAMAGPLVKEILEDINGYKTIEELNFESILDTSVLMPEVRGMNKEEAKKIIEKDGIKVKFVGEGINVKEMDILPGSLVKKDSIVTIELTKGSSIGNKTIVPDLTGYTIDMAQDVMKKIGLDLKFDKNTGKVIRQNVEAGEIIKSKDTIKVMFE
ncbi:MAG: stage V sporulation protein D [Sarcina sp.]